MKWGQCPTCSRTVALKSKGQVLVHSRDRLPIRARAYNRCQGSLERPVEGTVVDRLEQAEAG